MLTFILICVYMYIYNSVKESYRVLKTAIESLQYDSDASVSQTANANGADSLNAHSHESKVKETNFISSRQLVMDWQFT